MECAARKTSGRMANLHLSPMLTAMVAAIWLLSTAAGPVVAAPAQEWILDEGSAQYPRCMIEPAEPINMPGGEEGIDAIYFVLAFATYPKKEAFASLDTFGDDLFAGNTAYTVSVVSTENPSDIYFSGDFKNAQGYEHSNIEVLEASGSPDSVVQKFARSLFGDTPRAIFVENPTGGARLGPFPVDVDATAKIFAQFRACVQKL